MSAIRNPVFFLASLVGSIFLMIPLPGISLPPRGDQLRGIVEQMRLGQYDQAIDRIHELMEEHPDWPNGYRFIAAMYAARGDWSNARRYVAFYERSRPPALSGTRTIDASKGSAGDASHRIASGPDIVLVLDDRQPEEGKRGAKAIARGKADARAGNWLLPDVMFRGQKMYVRKTPAHNAFTVGVVQHGEAIEILRDGREFQLIRGRSGVEGWLEKTKITEVDTP